MYENTIENILEAQNGNKEILSKLITDNNGLIWSIVKRFNGRSYEIEDLYQIGCMGFIKAIKRFDISLNIKLSTYAVPYILGEIKRFIRDDGAIKISRSIKELSVKIKEAQKEYIRRTGEEIGINELVQELKVSKEDIVLALDSLTPIESINDEAYQSGDGKVSVLDKINTNIDEASTIINKITLKNMIDKLDMRDKQIILLRYYKEKTQAQVAKVLGITQVQVSRIEKRILNSMKVKLIN